MEPNMSGKGKTLKRYKRKAFIEAYGNKCFYCGEYVTNENAQIDHVVPYTECKSNRKINFVLACEPCNAAKASFSGGTHDEIRKEIARVRGIDLSHMLDTPADESSLAEVLQQQVSTTSVEKEATRKANELLDRVFGK